MFLQGFNTSNYSIGSYFEFIVWLFGNEFVMLKKALSSPTFDNKIDILFKKLSTMTKVSVILDRWTATNSHKCRCRSSEINRLLG